MGKLGCDTQDLGWQTGKGVWPTPFAAVISGDAGLESPSSEDTDESTDICGFLDTPLRAPKYMAPSNGSAGGTDGSIGGEAGGCSGARRDERPFERDIRPNVSS